MKIYTEEQTKYYDEHSFAISSKAFNLINVSEKIVEKQLEVEDYIPLSYVLNYSIENNLSIDIIEIDEKSIIYILTIKPYDSTKKMNGISFGVNYV